MSDVLFELAEPIETQRQLPSSWHATRARKTNHQTAISPPSSPRRTQSSMKGVGVDLVMLADSRGEVHRGSATRFTICFPVPPKRLDDVMAVRDGISWTSTRNHIISDMCGDFEIELGEIIDTQGVRQHFTAAEAPWQNGLVERNEGIWKGAARKVIKDVGAHGFTEMRRMASVVNWAKNAGSILLDIHLRSG